jgi:hypothetical protein
VSEILLDPKQVEARIGLKTTTLAKRRVYGGGPPYIKVGSKVLYPERELTDWINSQPRFQSTAESTVTKPARN